MKKISSLLISVLCFIIIFVSGCTYADNATLLSIQEKYNTISKNNSEFFNAKNFSIDYNSCPNLKALTVDERYELYYNLKNDGSLFDFSGKGAYAVLIQAINSTNLTNNALSIISNNNITDKKYKKNMYLALSSLQKNIKTLKNNKDKLESVYNTDGRDADTISKNSLTEYNFNKYIKSLNVCLENLLSFNINYNDALLNNISPDIPLEELLYSNKTNYILTKDIFNKLINTANIYISNYILFYSAKIKENVGEDDVMISTLRKLLQLQISLKDEKVEDVYKVNDYKLLRTLGNSVSYNQTVFNSMIKDINNSKDLSLEKNNDKITFITSYRESLLNYANKIIKYLESL